MHHLEELLFSLKHLKPVMIWSDRLFVYYCSSTRTQDAVDHTVLQCQKLQTGNIFFISNEDMGE